MFCGGIMSSIVYVKAANGTKYAYKNISYWDKEKKKPAQKRECIGHVDPITGEIVPNRKKGDASRAKQDPAADASPKCTVKSCGVSLLLDKAAAETGLLKVLRKVYPDDYSRILTCAYYLISEGGALCHAEPWSSDHVNPYGRMLSDQRISELLIRTGAGKGMEFFCEWIKAQKQDEYFAMDISSVSSYSSLNEFVRYGYNRDGEDLPQINLLMVTGEESTLPIYYRVIPGSIKDVRTVKESLKELGMIFSGGLHYVMDKGFYSKKNVDEFYASHSKFMIGVPFTSGIAKNAVAENRGDMVSHHNYCSIFGDELYATTKYTKWDGHRCYVHTYYDSLKAELDHKRFNHLLLVCHEELTQGKECPEHQYCYKKFFHVKTTPKRGRRVEYNEEEIRAYRRNYAGWFVMATNDIKDPVKALEIYRRKDAVEKSFDDLKNDLDMKRLRIHSAAAMDGRIFIQFIALILTSWIKKIMNDNNWFMNHDLQSVINEMKSIRKVTIEGHRKQLTTTLTRYQQEIVELFNLSI